MRNKFSAMLLVFAFLMMVGSPVQAATVHQGRPSALDQGNAVGYYIWQEGNRWQVRTVNAGSQHLFTGMIETDGSFADASTLASEKAERIAVDIRAAKIEFSFNTASKMDGFSFVVNGGQKVTLTLYLDGMPVNPINVYIGGGNQHPAANGFALNLNDDVASQSQGAAAGSYNSADLQGQPAALNPGNVFGYFIWQDQNRWYLQTTTTGAERQFTGTIETEGTISDVTTLQSKRADGAAVTPSSNKIGFAFKTGGANTGVSITFGEGIKLNQPDKLSGLSFLVSDAATLGFTLYVDGQAVDPANIYLGSANRHPVGTGLKIYSRNK